MSTYPRKMLFMTSLTKNGTPIIVDVLGENKRIEGGLYIRYSNGGTDTTWPKFLFETPVELAAENKRLQARVAENCDAPVGWIAPDKYRAACESKMEFFKTIKELREQNDRLQARIVELNECLTKASEMVEGQGFYRPVVRRFKAALRANGAGRAGGVQ